MSRKSDNPEVTIGLFLFGVKDRTAYIAGQDRFHKSIQEGTPIRLAAMNGIYAGAKIQMNRLQRRLVLASANQYWSVTEKIRAKNEQLAQELRQLFDN